MNNIINIATVLVLSLAISLSIVNATMRECTRTFEIKIETYDEGAEQ